VNPPEIIHGKVTLQGRNGLPLGVPLTLQLYTGSTLAQTITTTLDAYGKFSEQVNAPNAYTLKAKAGSYLSITIPNVAIAPQGFAYRELVFTVNGDINGDDVIDDADLLGVLFLFVPAWGTIPCRGSMMYDRITFDPQVMGGRACIRGMRIPVSLVVKLVANGMTVEQILREYPDLEAEDVHQALQYAADLVDEELHPLVLQK